MSDRSEGGAPDIQQLREKLNALDAELVAVLSKRMALIPDVAEYKIANNVERYQPKREAEVIARLRALAEESSVNPELIEDVIKRIIEDAHRIEKEVMGS